MKLAAVAATFVLVLVPAAEAKFRLGLVVSPAQPAVGPAAEIVVRTEPSLDPGLSLGASEPRPQGFFVPLQRSGSRWQATVSRPGRWRVVSPVSAETPASQ